ncbi:Lsr2 family protein [Rhodococcus sp. BP-149]|uniref:histone-like nucleoid-structuring protein Lsr2 n=1 Tax=unclassified Rhodococcus (in: high G+C Gram-positive bacteria) TaxID=192944 RepID=UPI001C9BA44B|nr:MULTISPECIES: Lsr2 family protein [unclassified Rhodococcus (in: high G+C Gram-positive bacteria)]MBY6687453.1 Lsr2 family protein [Rhodococcus sp. BP-288]MBY6696503.1 Lsr2 family protein [Rhodococcus sp. BP-188]MBY6700584.1 Lsr2 family protein [Rhodococcus sp. BP-285]MBY6704393.1 Lsr2 family protein [Rhodococcus sp. BP-283]MBY6713709.1 Lsr2 family protein [Rhodococcus sp. BP-160]
MAKREIVELTDDIDGSGIADGAGETIDFSVNGVDYRIDLKDKNAREFHRKLDYYIGHAERVGGRKRTSYSAAVLDAAAAAGKSAKRDPEQTRAIREWANANGYTVSDRGRIPAAVVGAFDAAH